MEGLHPLSSQVLPTWQLQCCKETDNLKASQERRSHPLSIPPLHSTRLPRAGRILWMGKAHCWLVTLGDATNYKRNSKYKIQISPGKCGLDRTLSNNTIIGTKRFLFVSGHKLHAALNHSSAIYHNKALSRLPHRCLAGHKRKW